MKNNKTLILLTFAGLVAMQQTQAGWTDVTQKVKDLNGNSFTVDTATFGDPAPGVPKILQITGTKTIVINEQAPIVSDDIVIVKATYGNGNNRNNRIDVTNKVKELIRAGQSFKVENSNLGGDPAPGINKTLEITLPTGKKEVFDEHNQVTILSGDVSKITYGSGNNRIDVTNKVKELVRAGKSFKVDNSLGGDPAPGSNKTLEIIFPKGTETYSENTYMPAANRIVESAQFGSNAQPAQPAKKPRSSPCYLDSECENYCDSDRRACR
ncbi:MAG: hypothetical protein P4L31_03930 [Candidatus Babeliales bacterium]|nr:hypothetical protein [Candidatus Babeliales bacterium]